MLVLKLCQTICPTNIPVTVTTKLGDGADGEVFQFSEDNNKVIKFCVLYDTGHVSLEKTYNYISKVLTRLTERSYPTYAHVYAHKYMGEGVRQSVLGNVQQKYIIYYYIMEKLQKISDDEKKVFHSILCHEDREIKKDFSPAKVKEMLSGLSLGLDFDEDKVILFVNNFKKTPVVHNDLHVRNIMKNINGEFKLIDFDRCSLNDK